MLAITPAAIAGGREGVKMKPGATERIASQMQRAADDGVKLLEAAERHGLEGVVSKRRDQPLRVVETKGPREKI
jgi:ATP-dependent DNA ligase